MRLERLVYPRSGQAPISSSMMLLCIEFSQRNSGSHSCRLVSKAYRGHRRREVFNEPDFAQTRELVGTNHGTAEPPALGVLPEPDTLAPLYANFFQDYPAASRVKGCSFRKSIIF
jgi:hypothetical protein